ncbi:oxepin-CoA hydrolase/3-oxo-5,6-dehydrosuberyl-CoA semialdehyde dehydrogenase [Nocardiopsis sp. Huas11]|uniref:phenylacetic acid degradation bifunctional protein PaaZ n=1 Tax=Nocardiopsis sp. Huas11 TaxID=2183912 RepID=UPI000EB16689|nr:phenylacetic acid degradation bifunctional protein PaaZ [Nocardiopsis sp. Huas11]RKS06553.1 oxepin-CoA hydrolase/3-oxo-5,6-dehydrosuberyl-CoA semialdehyde dehydrogenase [Nocardiopsis sp. Huas11]
MAAVLESYAQGSWFTPSDEGTPLPDANTGETVALFSRKGPDVSAMVEYARTVGGPGVRALTFHQRASLLKEVGKHLMEYKDEFYALSHRTGATKRDTMVDVDGGFGTLFSFSSKGRRELPNSTVILDGPLEPLGKGGTFVAQHVYTSRPGVAVQINAFNFPVWGMLEKLAPAFIAGLPSIVKPAPQTAYLTVAVVRRIIESGLLPEGSLQLLTAGHEGLVDALGPQDILSFTGSASTGAILRNHPNVVSGGVQLNVEADSLNCSILGPDVAAEDPEFDLYVKQVVAEMTVKAGQKCTAIRRILVPESMADAVTEALTDRLSKVVIGAADQAETRMGPLVSLAQRDEVRRSVKALRTSCELVYGDLDQVEVAGGDAESGAFVSPILLRAEAEAAEPHEVEAFGPVATIITYGSVAEAVELAARGRGSLVGSLVTQDEDVAREVVLGSAPWHGRILVLNREDAKESTGHGSPMPVLVHGGPGRAGGGEEMGGVRGVKHHMQRTAVQGTPDMLTAITGQWTTGSRRAVGDVHPFRKNLAELRIGDTIESAERTVTRADIDHFAEFTGDTFYAHTDEEAAAANPLFGGIVAHGYLVVSLAAGLFVDPDPGPVLANFGVDNLRFLTPVKEDATIKVTLTAKQITPRTNAEYGEVRWDALVTDQDGEPVATYDVLTLVAKGEE